jgi:hypothetical protein
MRGGDFYAQFLPIAPAIFMRVIVKIAIIGRI